MTNALGECGLYPSLFQLCFSSIIFSIFLLYLCILRKPEVFHFITCVSYCAEIIIAQQKGAEPFNCNIENVSKQRRAESFHFNIENARKLRKKCQTTTCHSLFPAWKCRQRWILPIFVPTVGFTSSHFSRQYLYNNVFEMLSNETNELFLKFLLLVFQFPRLKERLWRGNCLCWMALKGR